MAHGSYFHGHHREYLCPEHHEERIQMHCDTCSEGVCLKCIAYTHPYHRFKLIDDVTHEKDAESLSFEDEVENLISSLNKSLNKVKTNHHNYSEEMEGLYEKIKTRREKWKKDLDSMADGILGQLNSATDKDLQELKNREAILNQGISELKKLYKTYKDKLSRPDHMDMRKLKDELKEKQKRVEPCLNQSIICPPHLREEKTDADFLKQAFGQLIREGSEKKPDSEKSMKSDPSSSTVTKATSVSHPYTEHSTISTSTVVNIFPEIERATCIATVGEDKAWVGRRDYGHDLVLVNTDNQVLQEVNVGFTVGDIAVTATGELFVTDPKGHRIMKYDQNARYASCITNSSPYQPRGICTTLDDDLLVCLYNESDSKIVRLSATGHIIQTIPNHKLHQPLFTDPTLIAENINKDVCIVDGWNALVVLDKAGHLRHRYADLSTLNTSLRQCEGIVCDESGYVLLSIKWDHSICVIDEHGRFVDHVLAERHGIYWPLGLSINCKGELWACNNGNEIKVIKYRSQ